MRVEPARIGQPQGQREIHDNSIPLGKRIPVLYIYVYLQKKKEKYQNIAVVDNFSVPQFSMLDKSK